MKTIHSDKLTEHQLQTICVKWFRIKYRQYIIFAIPNGGFRHYSTAIKLKAEGVLSGVPDLFIPIPNGLYCGLFIEMKVGYNKETKNQLEFIEKLTYHGYKVKTCKTLQEFQEVVDNYFLKLIK
jgi:hypothetical protein